ncbi:MAG: HPF/RaiA family ribosome-associated protein [Myxococcales bacterium]|nr:HPF/RaiA family ribosome-associated protein [Myxococcales bacterium]
MNIELVTRDLEATDMLRERIELKLSKIQGRLDEKLHVRVRLSSEGPETFGCAIQFNAAKHDFSASTEGPDLVRATDETITKIERQVQRVVKKTSGTRAPSIRGAAV